MRSIRFGCSLAAAVLALAACGQKGPLELPRQSAAAAQPASPASAPLQPVAPR